MYISYQGYRYQQRYFLHSYIFWVNDNFYHFCHGQMGDKEKTRLSVLHLRSQSFQKLIARNNRVIMKGTVCGHLNL